NEMLQWITSGLFGAYVASNLLKWYWWRFNGAGFFWGMVCGLIPALLFRYIFHETMPLYTFPLMLVISLIGAFIGTFATKATDETTLKTFYKTIKPWGFWKPIHDKVLAEDSTFEGNQNFKRDAFNVVIGIIWQVSLVIFP